MFQEMATIVRDYFSYAIFLLSQLTIVNFKLLKQQTLERIVYITEQLISKSVPNSKDLFLCLIQQISVSKTDE